MFDPDSSALVLAPMEGMTDAPTRALLGEIGAFTYGVTEFQRVSVGPIPPHAFLRLAPELARGSKTESGLPIQLQLLGGDPEKVAESAVNGVKAGAVAIDLNFGCPAPTVNRHDGGASLLRTPDRIREIVSAVRQALPSDIPVSAKLRLGWEDIEDIHKTSAMAIEGGASWLTIHARTRVQGYQPPVYWPQIVLVRQRSPIPVIANGDIWTLDDFKRCQDETGCRHFMIGRGALATPILVHQIAREQGLPHQENPTEDWKTIMTRLVYWTERHFGFIPGPTAARMKQWFKLAHQRGTFDRFHEIKVLRTWQEILDAL